jgi:short-subunit dehydrogenase
MGEFIMSKTALITGASSGIGKEIAKLHASQGGDLIVVSRNTNQLNLLKEELEKAYGIHVFVIEKDLSLPNSPKEIYDEIKTKNIEVDYLVNNAGFGGKGRFHEETLERDIQMINVNIIALTKLTKLFLADFVRRGNGKILNISSCGALVPGPMQAVYCATKAYVTSFSNAVCEEIRGTGVTLTTVMPGATDTEFAKIANMEHTSLFQKTVPPILVAKASYHGMLKGKINVIIGVVMIQRILLRFAALLPKKFLLKQIYKMQTDL